MIYDAKPGFTFGADPELFVFNRDGVAVSAEGLIPGTKEDPYKVDCGAVQVDGMAAEFNINPAKTFAEFDNNITVVLGQLAKMLPTGYTLQAIPAVTFDADVFNASPDCAKELGCSPDFNAWTGSVNPPPRDEENPYLRTASGHIHIGWTDDEFDAQHIQNCNDLVKQLDWFLGGWSLMADSDPTRRRLYGKAGACRYKPYGVEYRVLSNFWITSKKNRLDVWNRLQLGIEAMAKTFYPEVVSRDFSSMLIDSINTSAPSQALYETFKYPLVSSNRRYARV